MSPLTITRLEIVDFKRIEAAAIDATTGKPIVLTGDNGQGKTSILDSILWALTRSGTDKPIHAGSDQATVALTLSNGTATTYTVRRRQNEKGGHYLDVLDAEGGKVASPQKFLDSLVGNLAFDPEAFTRLKPKEQADALRLAVGLDTADIDEEAKTVFSQRTEANRAKETAEKLYKACPVAAGGPREIASVTDLIAKRDKLAAEHAETGKKVDAHHQAQREVEATTRIITDLEAQLKQAKIRLAQEQEEVKKTAEAAHAAVEATAGHQAQIQEIATQLENIDAANAEAQAHNRALEDREAKQKAYRDAVARWTLLDNRLKELNAAREERIAACKFPVEGLAIQDDTVTVNGVPFADLNTAERIKLSALIAMAQNPTLKVVFIREGALISRQNLAVLAELAEQHGIQLWMEVFSETPRDSGFHIVDGQIAIEDGQPAKPKQMELI